MADTGTTEDAPITFTVKSSTDAKFTITLPLSTPVLELKQKLSSSEYADTPADRQRLIYSGRVLKDNETLESYKIKDGHTIHLVKSAASNQQRSNTSGQSSTSTASPAAPTPSQPAAGVPTNLAAGTGNNPLAGLTGARYAGFAQLPGAGLFGPDGGMGPPPDSDTMLNMLENPQFQSSINEALQNPQVIDMMIQQNPMLRDMGPGVRHMMQSPEFRRMLTDPNSIRQAMRMQQAMGMMGGGQGGAGNQNAFPAPGVTNTTPEGNQGAQQQDVPANPFDLRNGPSPFASLFGGVPGANPFAPPSQPAATGTAGQAEGNEGTQNTDTRSNTGEAAANPFAALLNPAFFGGAGQAGAGAGADMNMPNDQFSNAQQLLRDPALRTTLMQALGLEGGEGAAGAAGANPLASLFGGGGFGSQAAPTDNRPPEERYADQLRQLNDMGFFEFERNIEALRRSGGSVQGAVEYLLS
ncbi:Ubiquitin supergroup [Penicillium verhagenii]|nr:Ubiquitin supergroup [Penicillium verhagenii]